MLRERVLITVKTYPTLSQSHVELVCTAGFREDGSWVRIYPVPFRLLDRGQQFAKWTWVELPLIRRTKDKRPESYSPMDRNDIVVLDKITTGDGWRQRREFALKRARVWCDLAQLIEAGKRDEVSLATFKPAKMLGFEWQPAEDANWDSAKLATVEAQLRQRDFFDSDAVGEDFRPARKLPYDFYYRFVDERGKESRMRILDWEIGMLYWNCLEDAEGNEGIALEKVRKRYEQDFFARDLHLFLGTTYEWHSRAPNPWVIIGVFPPPHQTQAELF
jgi:hypothetical protein